MDMEKFIDWYNEPAQAGLRSRVDEETACVLLAQGWNMASRQYNDRLDAIGTHIALLTQHD